MVTRSITDAADLASLTNLLASRKLPFTVTIAAGRKRTNEQNNLQRLWMNDISIQLGDQTPEQVRAFCKLHYGVPILRMENETWAAGYDRVVKPLPYETKLAIMAEPLSFPVTSQMTVKQKQAYLDAMQQAWSERGIRLTDPEALKYDAPTTLTHQQGEAA